MRKNLTKEKIKKGDVAYGVFVNENCPLLVEVCGHLGFDYVLLDAEHSPIDLESVEGMVRAADYANITPVVRIGMNIRQNILRHMDTGALGAMIPMVNTKADAEAVVESMKYPPVGKRGLAAVRANEFGLSRPLGEYVKIANEETLVVVQVETVQAAENVKEIASVPGVDVVFIGPTDLSSAMGLPGQVNHPDVQALIAKLVKEIRASGKAAGTTAYDLDTLKRTKEQGFQFLVYNIIPMIAKSGREYLKAAKG